MPNALRPLLRPASVPWQICPSAAGLRLRASEQFATEPTCVDFVGQFLFDQVATPATGLPLQGGRTVTDLPAFQETRDGLRAAYHLVRLTFASGCWARLTPAHAEGSVVPEEDYDWSALWPAESRAATEELVASTRRRWRATGVCPNSRLYEVTPSPWLGDLGVPERSPWRHYLLLGTQASIDVLAKGWSWRLGQALPGW